MTLLLVLHASPSFWDDPVDQHQEPGSFGEMYLETHEELSDIAGQRPDP